MKKNFLAFASFALIAIPIVFFSKCFQGINSKALDEDLAFACRRSDKEAERVVRNLLEQGANPDFEMNDDRPLDRASEVGNVGVVRILLEKGANPNLAKASTRKAIEKMNLVNPKK